MVPENGMKKIDVALRKSFEMPAALERAWIKDLARAQVEG
jgi:hypothetical protein